MNPTRFRLNEFFQAACRLGGLSVYRRRTMRRGLDQRIGL